MAIRQYGVLAMWQSALPISWQYGKKAAQQYGNKAIWQSGNSNCLVASNQAREATMSKRPSLADTMRQAAVVEPSPLPVPEIPSRPAPPPEPVARPAGFYAATRAGKKKVTAALDPVTHKQLKSLAVERDATTEALLIEAIRDLLTKYGKPTRV
jgi:hypothetical protein